MSRTRDEKCLLDSSLTLRMTEKNAQNDKLNNKILIIIL